MIPGRPPSLLGLLCRLRLAQFRAGFRHGSPGDRLKAAAGALFLGALWGGLYLGSFQLLRFIDSIPGLGEPLIRRLGYLSAFAFFILLVFSNTVICFQLQYRSRETEWILSIPLEDRDLALFTILETAALATWAAVFIGAPVGAAYAAALKLSWSGCLGFVLYGFSLALLAAALGAALSSLIPRGKFPLVPLGAALGGAVLLQGLSLLPGKISGAGESLSTAVIGELLAHSRVSLSPLLPSAWAAEGFFALAAGRTARAIEMLGVLGANLLLLGWLALELNTRFLRENFSRRMGKHTRADARRELPGKLLSALLRPLPRAARALAVKDALIFLRDPAQWLQGLVLFGLLGFYVFSIRGFPAEAREPFWQALISTFNLAAGGLILGALGTRFIYPQVSLEGRAAWVLGLAPLRRDTILQVKLLLGLCWGLPIMIGLLLLAAFYLRLPGETALISAAAAASLTLGLDLTAVGMGALLGDFRQENPARIAAGFGGTLNLLAATGLVIASAVPLGVSFNLRLAGAGGPWVELAPILVILGVPGLGAAVFLLGARRFRNLEF